MSTLDICDESNRGSYSWDIFGPIHIGLNLCMVE